MVVNKQKQYARQNAWNRKNRKRLSTVMTIEKAEKVKQVAKRYDLSVNAFINSAIDYYLTSDPQIEENNQDNIQSDNSNNGIKYR